MTPESALMRQITDYLTIKGIWWMRCQRVNGRARSGAWMKSGKPGCADILCTPEVLDAGHIFSGAILWLELKSAKGTQKTAQMEFQSEVEAHGHYYLIVRDFTDLERWLNDR